MWYLRERCIITATFGEVLNFLVAQAPPIHFDPSAPR